MQRGSGSSPALLRGGPIPQQRYQCQEPTHAWEQIRPKLTDSAQMTYEIIRLVILWGETPKSVLPKRACPCGPFIYTPLFKDLPGPQEEVSDV